MSPTGPNPLALGRGSLCWPARLEGGREHVAGREAAVGPPLLRDVQHLLLGWEVVELIRVPDGLAEGQVAGQHNVFSAKRDDERTLHCPGTYPRNRSELGHEFVVGQVAQDIRVQPAI